DGAGAWRTPERARLAPPPVARSDDEAIRGEVTRVIGVGVDGDATGLAEPQVEAFDDARAVAEDGVGAPAAAAADHEGEGLAARLGGGAHPREQPVRPRRHPFAAWHVRRRGPS